MSIKKVLIVDDSHEFSFLITSLLKLHKNIEVESITSPVEAMKRVDDGIYDLFVIDYLMDEVDGFEVIRHIRQDKNNSNKRCILLTAKDLTDSELNTLNELHALYNRKPIMPNEFYKQIIDLLNYD